MFLGFALAVIAVRGSQKGPTMVAILVPMLALGLPLMDTGFAVVRRLYGIGRRGGESDEPRLRYVLSNFHQIFLPDRGHIHHKMLDAGMSHRRAVVVLYAIGVLFAISSFGFVFLKSAFIALMLLAVLVVLVGTFYLAIYFRIRRRAAERSQRPASKTGVEPFASRSQTQVR